MPRLIRLDPADTVAVAVERLAAGDTVDGVTARGEVPAGHKIAVRSMAAGTQVLKYGQVIGVATCDIPAGTHVHTHNCGMASRGALSATPPAASPPPRTRTTFEGYLRPDGRAGTRNYIGVIASVNCSATVCHAIAAEANRTLAPRFPDIDGFVAIVHDQGCGMAASGEGFEALIRVLKGYRDHPNFGGVLMVGLGCEVNQVTLYRRTEWTEERFASFDIQTVGGSRSAIARAQELLAPIAAAADRDRRRTLPASKLVLGMQCGGSDAFSGITANPVLGVASDMLVAEGGTSILSETPEIYGAEHLLKERADVETGARIDVMLAWWERYAAAGGACLDNNPSPGNRRGGLTTILEKSLGAMAKAGRAPLAAAMAYADRIGTPGLVFMDSPGYDPVAATGQVAAGANLIAFTTGRGSCFGAKPVPTLKLASTTELFRRMPDDMDIDCGVVVSEGRSLDSVATDVFAALLALASGERSRSEALGYGDNEFVPWKLGPVL